MTATSLQVPTILLVDDEPDLRRLAARVLRQGGYDVIEADGGEAAVVLCRGAGRIDLVVTDIRMPRVDGLEVAARCQEHRPGLPFLFMSGDWPPSQVPGPLLAKPFELGALAAAVRHLLT